MSSGEVTLRTPSANVLPCHRMARLRIASATTTSTKPPESARTTSVKKPATRTPSHFAAAEWFAVVSLCFVRRQLHSTRSSEGTRRPLDP
eukprot:3084937-Rhodomonas_salina.1